MADLAIDIFNNTTGSKLFDISGLIDDVDLYALAINADEIDKEKILLQLLRENPKYPINLRSPETGRNLLHEACVHGHTNLAIQLIREFEANVDHETFLGRDTPLHLAVMQGRRAIVVHLLQHGANPNYKNKYCATPIHYVQSMNIAIPLIRYGANLNVVNKFGKSVIECLVAQSQSDDELIDFLMKVKEDQLKADFDNQVTEVREYEAAVAEIDRNRKRILANRHLRKVEEQARKEYLAWRGGGVQALISKSFKKNDAFEDEI
mmetsp:Transcript_36694/g.46788  ORF Transcript_36694/g.46788 Transcript_36694/m.46788 type:complete len:264 (-) Transcript_36694:91-882(-)